MARKKDLVGSAFSELLVNDKFDYITTGVPPRVLEMKVAHEITLRTGDSDFEHVQSKAKELIDNELKKETLVVAGSGNYLAGPKSGNNDDDSNDMDPEGADEYEDEEDEDDEDDGEVKHIADEDYSPSYGAGRRVTARRGEGRVSARQKKSRFDSEDYVFPNKLKNFMKRTSPGTSPNKMKVPRKRPGPKPRKRLPPTTCSICRNREADEEISVTCKSCPAKAHGSCVTKELKGKPTAEWTCMHCIPRPNAKWKCAVCSGPPGKDLGVLVSCESCASQYHKQCHSPPIPETRKLLNSWRCSKCPLVQRSKSPVTAKRPVTPLASKRVPEAPAPAEDVPTRRPDSPPAHKKMPGVSVCHLCKAGFPSVLDHLICGTCNREFHSRCCRVQSVINLWRVLNRGHWNCDLCVQPRDSKFLNGTICFKCKRDFPNANDKATCSNCKLSFHARCCRAKEVANLTRLGSRRTKWRCDACKFPKGRVIPKKESGQISDDETPRSNADDSLDVDDGPKSVESEEDKTDAWWKSRLRPIKVGSNQPPLGPIPDPSVPDIAGWTAKAVRDYFDDFFVDNKIGSVFIEHEIDGKALKLMRRNDIISTFQIAGFGLDVILDVILHVKRLQLRVNDRRYIWADIM